MHLCSLSLWLYIYHPIFIYPFFGVYSWGSLALSHSTAFPKIHVCGWRAEEEFNPWLEAPVILVPAAWRYLRLARDPCGASTIPRVFWFIPTGLWLNAVGFQLTHHPGEVDLGLLPVSELLELLGDSPHIHPESLCPQKCPYNSCPEEKSSSKCALLDPGHPFLGTWEQESARACRRKPGVPPGNRMGD